MNNCIAALQHDEETNEIVMVCGEQRIVLEHSEELAEFIKGSPEIDKEIYDTLLELWFSNAEFEEVEAK